MGKDELKVIAAELVTQVRKSGTIDWTLREGAANDPLNQRRLEDIGRAVDSDAALDGDSVLAKDKHFRPRRAVRAEQGRQLSN